MSATAKRLLGWGLALLAASATHAATLSLPADAGARQTVTVSVPLQVDSVTGLRSADVRVQFSPAIVHAVALSLGPLTSSFQLVSNLSTPGVVVASLFGPNPVTGSGPILVLNLEVVGTLGSSTPLDLVLGELNEGAIPSVLQDGVFTVLPTYLVEHRSINAGGGDAFSASYRTRWSLGQELLVEASSAFGHVVQSGFWSFAGAGVVPVVLAVSPTTLAWSGNDPPYSVYRSSDCSNVGAALLVVTADKTHVDPVLPTPGQVLCYRVDPTPPGP